MSQKRSNSVQSNFEVWNTIASTERDNGFLEFKKFKFKTKNMENANFWNTRFEQTDLSGYNLTGANLSSSVFFHVNLSGAILAGTNLSSCHIVTWKKGLRDDGTLSYFSYPPLDRKTIFEGATLVSLCLDNMNFSAYNFKKTDLRHTSFHGAELKHTIFGEGEMITDNWSLLEYPENVVKEQEEASNRFMELWDQGETTQEEKEERMRRNLEERKEQNRQNIHDQIEEIKKIEIEKRELLNEINFTTDISVTDLRYADFSQADLSYANFCGTKLNGANFEGAKLKGTKFDDADLSATNFLNAELNNTSFQNANLFRANFMTAPLWTADDPEFKNDASRKWPKDIYLGSDFSNAVIIECNFSGADLTDSMFDGARIMNTNFRGANFSKEVLNSAECSNNHFSK